MPKDLCFSDTLSMSKELWELHKNEWSPMEPEYAKNFILYMVEEIGEVIAIVKKKSLHDVMAKGLVREHLIEELADILMYYNDTLNRFNISAEELARVYTKKHNNNLKRDYKKNYEDFLAGNA